MPQLRRLIGFGAIGLTLAGTGMGCVPAEQYAGMKMKADQYAEQLAHAQTDINTANARADAAERQLQNQNNGSSAQTAMMSNLEAQNSELSKQNAEWNQKYADAMNLVGRAGNTQALPAPLSNALSEFAARNPDVIDFDPARGVVKFKSDVTFPAGDAMVTPSAKSVLSKFATILNSAGADQYELLVAGNTDSTPVTNPNTIKRGNFDNWYLSAHRAISVGKELMADGVSAKRLGMVGYADQRPIPGGTNAQNRRVEVLILPTAARSTSSYAFSSGHTRRSHTATASPVAVPASAMMSKDAGAASPATMNK